MTYFQHEHIEHLKALAAAYSRRLRILDLQIAQFGIYAPAMFVLERDQAAQDLAKVRAELQRLQPGATDERAPYMGLNTFNERDADLFFGRETLVADLVGRVEHSSFLAVLGASGSGKSSVVRAGLIPDLKNGTLPGSQRWRYAIFKPGDRPLDALAAALVRLQGGDLSSALALSRQLAESDRALLLAADMLLVEQDDARLVLVIDQAEELWTLAPADTEARREFIEDQQLPFLKLLLGATENEQSQVLVILTMRIDFLHRAAEYAKLARRISDHDVIVSPMTPEELRDAILRPVELMQGYFEPGLVDELIEQVRGRSGALPLLQYTLLELWKARSPDDALTWQAFKELGGVEGALAARADMLLTQHYSDPELRDELRRVLLRLVQLGEGAVATRRRALLRDLTPAIGSVEALQALIQPLVGERLITTGRDPATNAETIEIVHEALIRAWPTFAAWIEAARADLRLLLQLEDAANEWASSGGSEDYLWAGQRLATTLARIQQARLPLSHHDQAFLKASQARERSRAEREVLLAQKERLHHAQNIVARGRDFAERYPLLALRLALEALVRVSADEPRERAEIVRTIRTLSERGRLLKLGSSIQQLYISPDGSRCVLDYNQSPVELRRTIDGELLTRLIGKILSISSAKDPATGIFVVNYDGSAAELRRMSDGACLMYFKGVARAVSIARSKSWSVDNRIIPRQVPIRGNQTATTCVIGYGDPPASTEQSSEDMSAISLVGPVASIHVDPIAQIFVVAYGNQPGEVRRLDNGDVLYQLSERVSAVIFSPDPAVDIFAVVYNNRTAELRYTTSGKHIPLSRPLSSNSGGFSCNSVAGVVTVIYSDSTVELLSMADGQRIFRIPGRRLSLLAPGSVSPIGGRLGRPGVSLDPTATVLIILYKNGIAELRDTTDDKRIIQFRGKSPTEVKDTFLALVNGKITSFLRRSSVKVSRVSNDMDARYLVLFYSDKTLDLWRTSDNMRIVSLPEETAPNQVLDPTFRTSRINRSSVYFSPDPAASIFIVTYGDRPGEQRHSADGRLISQLSGPVLNVTFSPGPRAWIFVVYYVNGSGEVRRTADGTLLGQLSEPVSRQVPKVTFSPDPSSMIFMVAYQNMGKEAWELWEARDKARCLIDWGLDVAGCSFDSSGRRLVIRYNDGSAYLLDVSWLQAIGGAPEQLSEQELIVLACDPERAGGIGAEQLIPYLDGETPRACREGGE
jgi:WD40 repeat protein